MQNRLHGPQGEHEVLYNPLQAELYENIFEDYQHLRRWVFKSHSGMNHDKAAINILKDDIVVWKRDTLRDWREVRNEVAGNGAALKRINDQLIPQLEVRAPYELIPLSVADALWSSSPSGNEEEIWASTPHQTNSSRAQSSGKYTLTIYMPTSVTISHSRRSMF